MANNRGIHKLTIDAIDVLLGFFTPEQKEILAINLNGQKITLMEQFVGRWWSYIPVAECPIEFKVAAAKVVEVHGKNWTKFIEKLKNDDIFSKLLDPDNYKEINTKETIFKMTDKKSIDTDTSSGNLVRNIGRTIGGEGGISKAYDYGSEWDRVDREKLDKMTVAREPNKPIFTTETGEEDDSRGTDEEEQKKNVKGWIEKKERLDITVPNRDNSNKVRINFKGGETPNENPILLHGAQIAQSSNATTGETLTSGNTFIDSLKRQNYDTTRERLILANAINSIHNIEFMDVRERIYKELDKLFIRRIKSCP